MKRLFTNSKLLAANFMGNLKRRFRRYADLCIKSGFMPKIISPVQAFAKFVSAIWVYIQVGRIRVVGAHKLDAEGHLIFCPNHSAMFDALIIYRLMKRKPRYMAAYEEMEGAGGWKQVLMGAAGCFPVDRSKGGTVIEPAVKALVDEKALVIFPEGKISETGEYLPFKTGSARIAIGACKQLGHSQKVGIVPIQICYNRRDNATAGSGFGKMGFKWRGGATVTVGDPIYVHEIEPLTPRKVTQIVRDAIVRQSCPTSFDTPSN
ncbi:MAG TPA: lysophospholipid acyltransferase family protein [Planktothrix sp.]|jgi:1-acyl-sn-glycerol-3-phosphate acyltransferase